MGMFTRNPQITHGLLAVDLSRLYVQTRSGPPPSDQCHAGPRAENLVLTHGQQACYFQGIHFAGLASRGFTFVSLLTFAGQQLGCGSKVISWGNAGFCPCFHLPGFHLGTGFLSHSQLCPSRFRPCRIQETAATFRSRHGSQPEKAGGAFGASLCMQPGMLACVIRWFLA